VALRIVEHAGTTDVGRQRHTNEDALLVSPPVFAVADGMGGAKAGEVASRVATEVFQEDRSDDEPPERRLAEIAREANRRIYKLAAEDESRRGMGTTLTAAIVSGYDVSLGHVGDSRAYRLRDGRLEQITKDHSLVAELERTGQISSEAAEHHPQRSIITRALGPEPDVEVDTCTVPGRGGDVYLLCSDGLTGMVSDEEVGSVLRQSSSLEEAAEALVRAANQSGGKDNITVVLFRLEDDESAGDGDAPSESETIAGDVTAEDVRQEARRQDANDSPRPAATTTAAPSGRTRVPRPLRPVAARRSPARRILAFLVGLAAIAVVVGGLYVLSRQVYFLGTNEAGLVTVYRGVPYELPLGVDLYEADYTSGVPARAIPRGRRSRVLDHEWRGREDAVDLVRELERGRLEPGGATR
jgi:serine/threonine protein phosphatase PrpC